MQPAASRKRELVLTLVIGVLGSACRSTTAEEVAPESPTPVALDTRPLDELAWIVGQWIDEAGGDRVDLECKWTRNGHFITRQFSVLDDDLAPLMEGTQVIGWDPTARQVRSWTFDSEGGFGEATWTQDGNRWLIRVRFTLATGERASALNILTRVDENTATWQSVNREVGGELQPNQPEVTVVRVMPKSEDPDPEATE